MELPRLCVKMEPGSVPLVKKLKQSAILKFLSGATTAGTQNQKAKITLYDRDSHRAVKHDWFKCFPWLELQGGVEPRRGPGPGSGTENPESADEAHHGDVKFRCKLCVAARRKNRFTEGNSAAKPKKDYFLKHERTEDHR